MPRKYGFVPIIVAFAILSGFLQAEEPRGSIKPLPEEPDPTVEAGPADQLYSHAWWNAKYRLFKQAQEDRDTATVVALAREMADGWLYNAPAAYTAVQDGISYLRGRGEESPSEDLIGLIRARAEVVQYVRGVNEEARDSLWAEIVCADYEIARIYAASGDYVSALRMLETYYSEQRKQRIRLSAAPYSVPADCPLDEANILSELLEAYSVLVSTTAVDPATAQGYFEAATRHAETLDEVAGREKVYYWGNQAGAAAYGNPVWTVDSLLLFMARNVGMAPARYVELAAARLKDNTVRDPFSHGDALSGKDYLLARHADVEMITTLYETYRTAFLAWPEAENSFDYQGISLSYLSFAIDHALFEKAKEIIGQLAGLRFTDPVHSEHFTQLQSAFQRAQ